MKDNKFIPYFDILKMNPQFDKYYMGYRFKKLSDQ